MPTRFSIARAGPSPAEAAFAQANRASAALLRRRGAVLGLSLIALVAIAMADLATGYELALSLLYVGPVVAATWAFGLRAGIALSLLATAAWVGTDVVAEHHYSLPIYRYWEGFIRLATFSLFALAIDQLRRALARSDDRLIKVLEGLDAAVCAIDPATAHVLYCNHSFEAAFPGEERERTARSLLEAAVEGGVGDRSGEEIRLGARWYLVRGRWLAWTDERPVLLLTATDITARRDAEALNREQEARLQATARLAAVGEIASSIAHELNQPLAAVSSYVRGCLKRLRDGAAEPAALAGALEQAGEQAERAGRIIHRVRDFVRAREPEMAEVDVNEIVARAARAAERGSAAIATDLAAGLPPVQADGIMLEQVVLNLVRNALEAMRDAGVSGGRVDVSTRAAGRGVEVTISDRGPGIDPQAASRLFEPFYTTKPEGMGLGLNICRSIVEFHGGRVWTTPREGGGARFHFAIPGAREAD